jgi:WD40 repeat protein
MMSGKPGLWLMLNLLFIHVSSSYNLCCQKQQEAFKLKNQLIKDPNELPIESSFQKKQWFQIWILRSVMINNKRYSKNIVRIILTYLDFMPITNVTSLFKHNLGELSHNGQWFLCMEDHCLYLYDLATGNQVQTFTTPRQSALASCTIAKSRLFVAGSSRKDIYLWNTKSSDLVTTLSGHTDSVTGLRFFLNDTRIFSCCYDQTLRIWTVENTPGHCLFVLQGLTHPFKGCYVLMDIKQIISQSEDGTLQVWNSHTGECIRNHLVHYWSKSNVLSEDGRYMASVNTGDKEIKLWDIYTGEYLKTVINSAQVYSIHLFYLATDRLVFGDGKKVYVWNLQTEMMIYSRTPFESYLEVKVQNISGIVDRKYLIIIGKEDIFHKTMKLYSFETGTEY